MLTEDGVRALLREAGATIDVPADPLIVAHARRSRRRRRTTLLAAAAVVGVVIGAGAVVGQNTTTTPSPVAPTPAPTTSTESSTPAPSPSSTPVQVARIPSVEGLNVAQARRRLERLGFTVLVDNAWACKADGRVVDTEPIAGRELRLGTTVTIYRTRATPEMC